MERFSRERGTAVFKREACGAARKSSREGEKWEQFSVLDWSLYA